MARTHGHGNPKWTRDETILALDLYFECEGMLPSRDDPRVLGLSNLLRDISNQDSGSRRESFRNPDGVAFKLQNLRNVATGKGLGNVSETDRKVWKEFGSNRERVRQLADLIRRGAQLVQQFGPSENDDDEFPEGRVLTLVHKIKERDTRVRKRLLASRAKRGPLACDMCSCRSESGGRKFEDAIFEVHHLVPIGMTMERKTRLADLALLCANCHRLLHRAVSLKKRWLGISEAQEALSSDA